jgi:hypothetical protein
MVFQFVFISVGTYGWQSKGELVLGTRTAEGTFGTVFFQNPVKEFL